MVGSILVVCLLIHCLLFYTMSDLKVKLMNMQLSLIWELILYELELGHNDHDETDNVYYAKCECTDDHSIVNRGFKKFRSCCKTLEC